MHAQRLLAEHLLQVLNRALFLAVSYCMLGLAHLVLDDVKLALVVELGYWFQVSIVGHYQRTGKHEREVQLHLLKGVQLLYVLQIEVVLEDGFGQFDLIGLQALADSCQVLA